MGRRATLARSKALAGGSRVRHLTGVTLYYAAMVLLSIGAFIHSKSPAPEMRPESEAASEAWRWLARATLVTWIALIVWGFRELHWSQPVAAVMVSLVGNAVIAMRGPRNAWPMLSMLFCGLGLAAAAIILFGWEPPS